MEKKLRYRVITGYNSNDYLSITDDFLEKAKICMITDRVFTYKGTYVRGTEIKKIEEDYRYYTGWNDEYYPKTQDDRLQIEKEMPVDKFTKRSELADKRVEFILNTKRFDLLDNPEKTDTLLLN